MPTLTKDQVSGVSFLSKALIKHAGALCADAPGYGKTAQSLKIAKTVLRKYPEPIMIIVPSYLVLNWLDEIKKWDVKGSICVIDSGKQILSDARIFIGSYDISVKKPILKQLLKKRFSLLVCDEAHTFRTWNSLRSRFILGTKKCTKTYIRKNCTYALMLTGTPIVNSVEDLYNIMGRVTPQIFNKYDKDSFLLNFAAEMRYTPWGNKPIGVKNEEALHYLTKDVILRRTVVKGVKKASVKYIKLELKGPKLKKFIAQENQFLNKYGLSENDVIDIQKIKKDDSASFAELRKNVSLHKIPLVMPAILDSYAMGERPVVYTWHKDTQAAIVETLGKKCKKARIEYINGEVPHKVRHKLVKEYQAGDIDILCPTIGALKEGVNLTEGKTLILVELPYTPAELEQVIARLCRKGQKNLVRVLIFHFIGGVDMHVAKLLESKQSVIDKALIKQD